MRLFPNKRVGFIFIILFWCEISISSWLKIQQSRPDFFLLFLVFYAFRIEWRNLIALGLLLGLTRDFFSNSYFGLETASFVASAVILQWVVPRLDREKNWVHWGTLLVVSFFNSVLYLAFLSFVDFPVRINGGTWLQLLIIPVYTSVVGAVLFPLMDRCLVGKVATKQYELF